MSKIIDITDKLSFEENPKIKVKDIEIELNSNALDQFKIIKLMSGDMSDETMNELLEVLFATKDDTKKVRALNLNMKDLKTFIVECSKTAVDAGEHEGETQTPATT